MIDVIYDRKRLIVKVKGHAQSGEAGHDLVCAAASILVYTLSANVTELCADRRRVRRLCWTSGRATPPSPVRRCMACRR